MAITKPTRVGMLVKHVNELKASITRLLGIKITFRSKSSLVSHQL